MRGQYFLIVISDDRNVLGNSQTSFLDSVIDTHRDAIPSTARSRTICTAASSKAGSPPVLKVNSNISCRNAAS